MSVPFAWNSTRVTPWLSLAVALTWTILRNWVFWAGELKAVAGALLSTVTSTSALAVALPAASRAFTVRGWSPFVTPAVFQLSA
jgi:hypothetical protein